MTKIDQLTMDCEDVAGVAVGHKAYLCESWAKVSGASSAALKLISASGLVKGLPASFA